MEQKKRLPPKDRFRLGLFLKEKHTEYEKNETSLTAATKEAEEYLGFPVTKSTLRHLAIEYELAWHWSAEKGLLGNAAYWEKLKNLESELARLHDRLSILEKRNFI